jgi:hypothetical protein
MWNQYALAILGSGKIFAQKPPTNRLDMVKGIRGHCGGFKVQVCASHREQKKERRGYMIPQKSLCLIKEAKTNPPEFAKLLKHRPADKYLNRLAAAYVASKSRTRAKLQCIWARFFRVLRTARLFGEIEMRGYGHSVDTEEP